MLDCIIVFLYQQRKIQRCETGETKEEQEAAVTKGVQRRLYGGAVLPRAVHWLPNQPSKPRHLPQRTPIQQIHGHIHGLVS